MRTAPKAIRHACYVFADAEATAALLYVAAQPGTHLRMLCSFRKHLHDIEVSKDQAFEAKSRAEAILQAWRASVGGHGPHNTNPCEHGGLAGQAQYAPMLSAVAQTTADRVGSLGRANIKGYHSSRVADGLSSISVFSNCYEEFDQQPR